MVPPPNSTGEEFPDFDSMSPEEQMAWLESLARRQGAKPEEFTTAADLDIAEVSPDTVIDEPGYVPYSISEKEKPAAPAMAAEPPPAPSTSTPVPVEMGADDLPDLFAELEPEQSFEQAEEPPYEPATAGADPMTWLDTLSAQSEAELPEEMQVSEDDTAEFLAAVGEFEELISEAMPEERHDAVEDLVPDMSEAEAGDPLGGMDPMLWLESLAKRQGANLAELTTSADLEIEQPPEDAVIDEPGYVPYDVVAGGPRKVEEPPAPAPVAEVEQVFELEPEPEPLPEPELDFAASFEVLPDEELDAFEDAEPMLDGADPMEWLESLAKRQGAKAEELMTSAGLDIPELPKETVIDEPGYVAFSPFGESFLGESAAEEEESAYTSQSDLFAAEPDAGLAFEPATMGVEEALGDQEVDESLAWLADLASEPEMGMEDLFAAPSGDADTAGFAEAEADRAAAPPDDILAGMTDEEVAYAQAHGQLTPHQELEWLKRQAAKLADVRSESDEMSEGMDSFEPVDLPPAAPGSLPSWLEDMRTASEAEGEALFAETVASDAGATSVEDWLDGMASQQEAEVAALTFDSDVDSLWADISDEEAAAALDSGVIAEASDLFAPASALDADVDPLAEALDSEYERKLMGDESEPEWYTQALRQDVDSLLDAAIAEQAEAASDEDLMLPTQIIETADLTEAVLVDVPQWLMEVTQEPPAAPSESDMPAWLTESADAYAAPAAAEDMPDWLTEPVVAADDVGWLETTPQPPVSAAPARSAAQVPQPKPVTSSVEPEISTPAARPLPEGELFGQYRQRLEHNPNDHPTRLALARALRSSSALESSLDQYEALIEVAQLLPDIGSDLSDLVKEHEHEPRIRRLLGDTFMRKGMLREALDAYRSALDQL